MNRQAFAILLTCLTLVSSAEAANLASSGPHARTTVITLTGEIAAGDADTLRKLIKAAINSGRLVSG
jgi:hypothetical protein